jgi:1-acyl-sn-glycerol-3-phosphate acyltransferase
MMPVLRRGAAAVALYLLLTLLGLICLGWTLFALPLWLILPVRAGARCGRYGILVGFRCYVWTLRATGAYRLDLGALRELRGGPPVVLAPNHPSLIDALFIIAHDPNVVCVMKSALKNNLFLGAGARLARYIGNEPTRHMIVDAVAELGRGTSVLLFPEGTRTVRAPVNEFKGSVAIIARHAQVPVQTLIIEQDSAFLGKGWSLFRPPTLPIVYRVRLGRRFNPAADARELTRELESYFREQLAHAAQNAWIAGRRHELACGQADPQ